MRRARFAVQLLMFITASLLATAFGGFSSRGSSTRPATSDFSDTLRIYYVGHAVGYEYYQLHNGTKDLQLTGDIEYRDRGRRTHVVDTLRAGADWTPRSLAIWRVTDTSRRIDTRMELRGREATVVAYGDTSRVMLPTVAFGIGGDLPTSQHLALIQYWLAHGRPARLAVVPGGPTNDVTIERRGRDTLSLGGRPVVLDRYAVDGVVWGVESAWIDAAGRLAGFTTGGGGGLGLEAVRLELDPLYAQLVALATKDRMADLARLSRRVRPLASGTVALVGATLVDGTGRDAVPNATVVTAAGRVVAAGPRAAVSIPAGARRVDVTGKTVVPGLWDMHSHNMQMEWAPVYLAAGITTVRDMGNELGFILALRDAVQSGNSLGPSLLLAGLVDGGGPDAFGAVSATTPEEGRAVVRMYHDHGFQQMKLYDLLAPDVVGAITAEAHRLGMTVTGHLPRSLSLTAAIDSGMDHFAHMPIRGDAGSDSVRRMVQYLAAHHTVWDPTVSWGELGGHSTAEPVSDFQPGINHVPPVLAQRIAHMGAAVDTATAHARLRRTLAILSALHRAGVPIVDGTDEGVPGYSVYRDLELFVAAGMTPMEALQAATAVPARVMHLESELGTVEPGKRADLVVLDGNPLERISNVGTVRMVMKNGTLYRSADIWRAVGFRP